jgi:superfamily II DNA helicase RecQ
LDYLASWKFAQAHLAGSCRRKILPELFSESTDNLVKDKDCCDVCKGEERDLEDFKEELKILVDALKIIGAKGEVKIAEWIRGSAKAWTEQYDKQSFSYGNHREHDLEFWRNFMRQCMCLV